MANLLTPRQWRNKALIAKSEVTYGVDPTPSGAANWIEARNVVLTPMDNDKVARNIDLPYLGSTGDIIVSSWCKLTYDVAMAGSGTAGTAPKWGPLMLACGMAETIVAATSATYNLVSSAFGSICHYMNIDGVNHILLGGRGSVKGKISAKGTPMLSYTFDAVYVAPTSVALPSVTRTGWMIEEGVNSVNTTAVSVNGIPLALSTLDFDLGNKITRIDLPGPQREIDVSDRAPTLSLTVLAPAQGTFDPFAMATSSAVVPVTVTHGSAAGKKVQVNMNARLITPDYDKIDGILCYKLTMQPVPVSGNDEISIANI
jgi:hypothetical protein